MEDHLRHKEPFICQVKLLPKNNKHHSEAENKHNQLIVNTEQWQSCKLSNN